MLASRLADPALPGCGRKGECVRTAKIWPLAAGLVLLLTFVSLERTPPARASFMLVGLVDCGLKSGQRCSLGKTLTLLSDDSGAPVKYTIDLSWLKPSDLDDLDQDDQVKIEI